MYWAPVPLVDPKTNSVSGVDIPFLLPHEWLAAIWSDEFLNIDPCMAHLQAVRASVCASLKLDPNEYAPLGLHGDGVPHTKNKSIECLSWNVCGVDGCERVLFSCIEKQFCCNCGCSGRHTLNAMLDVFCWSARCMVAGRFPTSRHDGAAWAKSDKDRLKLNGHAPRAVLVQVRGDWSWYKQVFNFPSWANKSICWRCEANTGECDWTDTSAGALWRRRRLTDRAFFQRQRAQGVDPSPVFSLPGFRLEMVCVDVLHALDLGVTQDVIANILWVYQATCLGGGRAEQRVQAIWRELREQYKLFRTTSQLQGLTLPMIKRDGDAPKMRTKGAETRGRVPFAVSVALKMHEKLNTAQTKTIAACISHLMDFYMLMSVTPYRPELGRDACRKLCVLYKALREDELRRNKNSVFRRMNPKIHMFQELAEYQTAVLGNPCGFWNYQDEDFVGWLAKLAATKGGAKAAATTTLSVLQRYRSRCAL